MKQSYEYFESNALKTAKSQSERINFRLQAAFNYALSCELIGGDALDIQQISCGISNGFCSIMANIMQQQNSDVANVAMKVILCHIMEEARVSFKPRIEGMQETFGVVALNRHRGTA